MFPYTNAIYFWLDQDNIVIRDNMNIIIDNIYCITCITRWKNEGIIKVTQPEDFNDRIIHKSIAEIKDLWDRGFQRYQKYPDLLNLLKHKKYMKEITNRLLFRCFMKIIEHPKKNIIFDNNVQEKILSYL